MVEYVVSTQAKVLALTAVDDLALRCFTAATEVGLVAFDGYVLNSGVSVVCIDIELGRPCIADRQPNRNDPGRHDQRE